MDYKAKADLNIVTVVMPVTTSQLCELEGIPNYDHFLVLLPRCLWMCSTCMCDLVKNRIVGLFVQFVFPTHILKSYTQTLQSLNK